MLKLRAFPSIFGSLCKVQQEGAIREQRNAVVLSAGSAHSKELRGIWGMNWETQQVTAETPTS